MHAGTVYPYLSLGVGRSVTEDAFRALTCGYTHWASGRMDYMEVMIRGGFYDPCSSKCRSHNENCQRI